MGGNSYDTYGEGSASTYWRRRFIVLAIGLVILGLAAWALSSALAVQPESASRASRADRPSQPARTGPGPGNGHGADSGSLHTGGSSGGRSGAAGPGKTESGAHGSGAGHSGGQASGGQAADSRSAGRSGPGAAGSGRSQNVKTGAGQVAGHGTILPAFCGRRDIVLSVFAGQTQFGPKDSPTFELSIVSTQPTECTFNIGSAHLVLVIKEGPATIWSSADCPTGTASLDAALARGVPTVVTVTWNRKTSAPGCSSRTTRVPPGAYSAYAVDSTQTSEPVTFRLT